MTTTTPKHSPTPWRIDPDDATAILDEDGILIAKADGELIGQPSEADAAHSVHCVNAHDELVATLRAIKFHADLAAADGVHCRGALRGIVEKARAALAKAEGNGQ